MPQIIAHRGASATYPEHTRAAYVEALAQGADGLECDVRLTADGAVVLWHDATLDRTSDARGPLESLTLAQLRAVDTWSWRGTPPPPPSHGAAGAQVLALDDLVDVALAAGRPVTLVVELKPPTGVGTAPGVPATTDFEDATLATLLARGLDPATCRIPGSDVDVTFMSFLPAPLAHLAQAVPAGRLMFLVDEVDDAALVDDLAPGTPATPDVVAACRGVVAEGLARVADGTFGGLGPSVAWCRARPDEVRAAVDAGRTLRVWTVDDVADARTLLDLGVTELTTNRPGALRAELGAPSPSDS